MLMRLLWYFAGPFVGAVFSNIPAAPDPVDLVLPWPSWIPFWPFGVVIASVVVAGTGALAMRLIRWLYGLVPVIQ